MTTRYLIPAGIAAVFHLGLLGGFPRGPRAVARPEAKDPEAVCRLLMVDRDEPAAIERAPDEAAPKGTPDALRPESAEPPAAEVSAELTQPSAPPNPVSRVAVATIPISGPGRPDGIEGGLGGIPILRPGDLDNPPRTRAQIAPVYPGEAKRRGLTGEVTVEFLVDTAGAVREARVVRATDRVFEEATLRAVAKWRFVPGRKDGRVVAFRMAAPVVFSLTE